MSTSPVRKIGPAEISDAEAEEAFALLLRWIGEDTSREGLKDTPKRAVRAWKEFFRGYREDPADHLKTVFEEIGHYGDMVCLENIRLESYCEHHMVPIIGSACIAYIPNGKVVGISKLARVMEGYAKRFQVQEKLTEQIAETIHEGLNARGVAVAIRSAHQCLSTRGVHKTDAEMLTVCTLGAFRDDPARRAEFMAIVNRSR